MEYLKRVLGIQVRYGAVQDTHLPNFIRTRYRIRRGMLDEKAVLFIYPLAELPAMEPLKKHIQRIQEMGSVPAVMILPRLTYRQRESLLLNKIPFVVEGRQIYLPFMAVYLQEKCDAEVTARDEILPSAQMLLLYFIYQGAGRMAASQAVKALQLTSTSISRAVRQLEGFGVIRAEKVGVQKMLCSELSAKSLFEAAKGYLQSPVRRRGYIPVAAVGEGLLRSGCSALEAWSMLNPPDVMCYAAKSIAPWRDVFTNELWSTERQAMVELWRYDPRKLSEAGCVDKLSLALSLQDCEDERVEEAVEQMLNQLWRDIDGNRD